LRSSGALRECSEFVVKALKNLMSIVDGF